MRVNVERVHVRSLHIRECCIHIIRINITYDVYIAYANRRNAYTATYMIVWYVRL